MAHLDAKQGGIDTEVVTFMPTLNPKLYLDAKQGGVDDEVATFIKNSIGLRCCFISQQLLLPSHAPAEVNGLQVIHLRLTPLQLIGCCQGLVISSSKLAALKLENPHSPVGEQQDLLLHTT